MLVSLGGCAVLQTHEQAKAVEQLGSISGRIETTSDASGPVVVQLYAGVELGYQLDTFSMANTNGEYGFSALPGKYFVAAFVDADGDRAYKPGEPAVIYGDPTAIELNRGEAYEVPLLRIQGPLSPRARGRGVYNYSRLARRNLGRVMALDDPLFAEEHESLGLWRPLDFLDQVGGGLFLLQPFEEDRMPVLLVHGISGGPNDWREVIGSLDRSRIQPWVLQYPSGIDLDLVSDYLAQAVHDLQLRLGFTQLIVAAHSMGGLVTRSFVKKLTTSFPETARVLTRVISINSPMAGMSTAALAVRRSPLVLPAWRDVAAVSPFVTALAEWPWPPDIEYHLIFSYQDGRSDDGVVSLDSQLPTGMQQEATRLYAFKASHAGILKDPDFIDRFNALLVRPVYERADEAGPRGSLQHSGERPELAGR